MEVCCTALWLCLIFRRWRPAGWLLGSNSHADAVRSMWRATLSVELVMFVMLSLGRSINRPLVGPRIRHTVGPCSSSLTVPSRVRLSRRIGPCSKLVNRPISTKRRRKIKYELLSKSNLVHPRSLSFFSKKEILIDCLNCIFSYLFTLLEKNQEKLYSREFFELTCILNFGCKTWSFKRQSIGMEKFVAFWIDRIWCSISSCYFSRWIRYN